MAKIIGRPALPNMPWQDKPAGYTKPVWRYTGNPIIPRDAIPTSNSIFNSAGVTFGDAYAGVFRCDNRGVEMDIFAGFSKDGIHWEINHDPIVFEGEKDVVPADTTPIEERPLTTFSLAGRELALAAASQMSAGGQAVALVILLVNGANQLIEWGLLDVVGKGDELMAGISPAIVPAVIAFLAVALLLGAAVSLVVNLVRYAGYRVERYADRVVVEHGLLSRSSRALATGRVQYVVVRQGIIRQFIGYAEVTAQVVSAPGEKDGEPSGSVLLHPFIRMGEVDAFLAEVLPDYAGVMGHVELGRLGPVARRRSVVRAVIWWPFATAIFFGVHWLFGLSNLLANVGWLLEPMLVAGMLLSAVLLVGLVADALLAWGAARYGHTDRELVLVTGGLTRLTVIAPRARLQRMEVRANPFQRRAGVATLSVRTAASDADGLELRDLPAVAADELLAWYRPRGERVAVA